MSRILTGIQSTNIPHLGNILGAILPAIKLSEDPKNESLLFIADMHSLISEKDAAMRIDSVNSVAATWLAFDFNTEKNLMYRQSRIPEVCELAWYLNCFTPFPMLANAHSFKDKVDRLSDVNAGLFTYPVLMAADIILYDAEIVPVGKDQIQHLEIARDIVSKINGHYGKNLFVMPSAVTDGQVMIVPGTDGTKMSKSRHNFINIFLPEKELKKVVLGIVTDAKTLEEPKNPDTCTVFNIFKLIASPIQITEMRVNYEKGGYGYGHAKLALYDLILSTYSNARERYTQLMTNTSLLENELRNSEVKAKKIASAKLVEVRDVLGF